MTFHAYMLRCADGTYYVGHTDDLDRRVAQHESGLIPGYTQRRRPVRLVWSETFQTRLEALEAERQVGNWSRAKKEALIRGDWDAVSQAARKPSRPRVSTSLDAGSKQTDEVDPEPRTRSLRVGVEPVETPYREAPPAGLGTVNTTGNLISPRSLRVGVEPVETPYREARTKSDHHPPAIVLVRPQLGENIGAVARAMLNFGLTDLRLVAPRDGWPNPAAGPAASGADEVLERARVYATVPEAIADARQVFATTVRRRELVLPVVTPEAAAQAMHTRPGPSAVLFGAERSGLETDEAALAGAILTIPVNPAFGSLNLAQAALVVAYEWSRGAALATPTARGEAEPPATHSELDGLVGQLDAHLSAVGYFHPPSRAPATRRTLRTILTKPGWSSREVRAMRGMLRAIAEPRQRVAAEPKSG